MMKLLMSESSESVLVVVSCTYVCTYMRGMEADYNVSRRPLNSALATHVESCTLNPVISCMHTIRYSQSMQREQSKM